MAATVNVNGSADPFYRYKMPCLDVKTHKKTTRVENIDKIAKSLHRPMSYCVKWFSKELSTSCSLERSVLVLKGIHNRESLSNCLTRFIKLIVLCANCGNPETTITINSKKHLELNCKACGSLTKIQSHKHSLIKFICGEYKPAGPQGPQGKADFSIENFENVDESDLDGWSCDTSEEAIKKRAEDFFDIQKPTNVTADGTVGGRENGGENGGVDEVDDTFIVFESSSEFKAPTHDIEYELFIDNI